MLDNRYKHPSPGWLGRCIEGLANSRGLARLRHAIFSCLPFMVLESDVEDVVYLSWIVDAQTARRLLPAGVTLREWQGKTLLTGLSYRHGHFGPKWLGPLRKLCPSPQQSNWRIYLAEAPDGAPRRHTVFFLKNIMDSLLFTAGTRLFSDVLATHLARHFYHGVESRIFMTMIDPGESSGPALSSRVRIAPERVLPASFASLFASWEDAVAFVADQEAAVAYDGRSGRLAFSEIDLPIDMAKVQPLEPCGEPTLCSLLKDWPDAEGPFCFGVPGVKFRVLSERLLPAKSR